MLTRREKLHKKLKTLRRAFRPRRGPAVPVLIMGEMRSGTNMLADCFDNCVSADVYHESDEEAFVGYELRDLPTIRRLIAGSNGSHAVFKPIADSNRALELLEAIHGARVIWIYRRYQDAVNSALEKWTEHREYLRLILEEPQKARWRAVGLSADDLALIRKHYTRELTDASARALIWYIRGRCYFTQQLQQRNDVMLINYEELVTNPREQLRAAFDFVALPFKDSYFQHVATSSIRKRPDPEIAPAIAALCDSLMEQFAAVLRRPVAAARSA
jgi:Sulfotransferase domain